MNFRERMGLALLHKMDPETAHGLSIKALNMGLVPLPGEITSARLKTKVAGLSFANPLGLAAGYDKNATAIEPLLKSGFGFLELGAATPLAQPGNPKPRLFRLTEDQGVINRFGFNNDGMEAIGTRLKARPKGGVVGLNLGANKTSEDRAGDFAQVLAHCGPHIDFATVNVSSPNTEKLRDLQGKAALNALLSGVMEARAELNRDIPVFLKIAPDLNSDELAEIAEVAREQKLSGIIATNTTLSREGLKSAHKGEMGGLSGKPLFEKSTRILAELSNLTNGEIPLIGVGGVSTAKEAYQKITAGASLVQIYSAMVYQGISMVPDLLRQLDVIIKANGFKSVEHAVGQKRGNWL